MSDFFYQNNIKFYNETMPYSIIKYEEPIIEHGRFTAAIKSATSNISSSLSSAKKLIKRSGSSTSGSAKGSKAAPDIATKPGAPDIVKPNPPSVKPNIETPDGVKVNADADAPTVNDSIKVNADKPLISDNAAKNVDKSTIDKVTAAIKNNPKYALIGITGTVGTSIVIGYALANGISIEDSLKILKDKTKDEIKDVAKDVVDVGGEVAKDAAEVGIDVGKEVGKEIVEVGKDIVPQIPNPFANLENPFKNITNPLDALPSLDSIKQILMVIALIIILIIIIYMLYWLGAFSSLFSSSSTQHKMTSDPNRGDF